MLNVSSRWNALTGEENCRLQIDVAGRDHADAVTSALEECRNAARAAEPGRATHAFEVHRHDGPGIGIQVGAEGEITRILIPSSLTDPQTFAATDEIRRIIYGDGCSLEEFYRRVADASGLPVAADRDEFFVEFRS